MLKFEGQKYLNTASYKKDINHQPSMFLINRIFISVVGIFAKNIKMKFSFLVSIFVLMMLAAKAQDKIPPVDQSVMDMSYCPPNFPVLKIQQKSSSPLVARIIYSRPALNGRKIFGGLVEYGKVWRLGANEATEIEFFRDVTILKQKIKKGRYTMLAIPNAEKWTIILNKELDTWGAFLYNPKKDAVRIEQVAEKTAVPAEYFSLYFENPQPGPYNLVMQWDSVKVRLPMTVGK